MGYARLCRQTRFKRAFDIRRLTSRLPPGFDPAAINSLAQ
jgi:hypothetical protein